MHTQSLSNVAGPLLGLPLEVSVISLEVEVIGSLGVGIWKVMNPAAGVLDRFIVLIVITHFFIHLVILISLRTAAICLSEHVLKGRLNEVQDTIIRKVAAILIRVELKGQSWVVF